eukprot:m51a1_g12917 hypothetical protein (129) ;mRNA; r:203-1180
MSFVLLSPHFPPQMTWMAAALARAGVRVLGVADEAYDCLGPALRAALTEYYRVGSMETYDDVYRALAFFIHKYGRVRWIERRKSQMKAFFASAGVPVARYCVPRSLGEAREFAASVGAPRASATRGSW